MDFNMNLSSNTHMLLYPAHAYLKCKFRFHPDMGKLFV